MSDSANATPVPPTAPRQLTEAELRKAAGELGARVVWALKFLKAPGGGMVMTGRDGSDGPTVMPWEDWFMDALDQIGYRIDRESFYARKPARRRQRP